MSSERPSTTELRAAIACLQEAVSDPDATIRSIAIEQAHRTLTLASKCDDPVASWVGAYLDREVWNSGPQRIAAAVHVLAAHFKMPRYVKIGGPDGDQGTLF